jgi:hypothetical protein
MTHCGRADAAPDFLTACRNQAGPFVVVLKAQGSAQRRRQIGRPRQGPPAPETLNILSRSKTMSKKMLAAMAIQGCGLLLAAHAAMAQRAPVEEYLMPDQAAEIALARSAAPESISRDAEVRVLGRHGFETAVQGSNGFVCIVGRSWTSAAEADFWDPKVRVPLCVNAPAARSYLVHLTQETAWILAGRTKEQLAAAVAAAGKTELPPMEAGAMCYMMSKQGYGGASAPHWPSHLMFFYPDISLALWGANLKGSPVMGVEDPTEHITQFVIPVRRWSDGTEDRSDSPHMHPSHAMESNGSQR